MSAATPFYYFDHPTRDATLYKQMRPLTVILLEIATLGLFQIIWFYRNWRLVQENTNASLSPAARSIFAPFFAYSLFSGIADVATDIKLKGQFLLRIAGILHLYLIIPTIPETDPYAFSLEDILLLITLLDIAYVQYKINQINQRLNNCKMKIYGKFDLVIALVITFEIILFIRFSS